MRGKLCEGSIEHRARWIPGGIGAQHLSKSGMACAGWKRAVGPQPRNHRSYLALLSSSHRTSSHHPRITDTSPLSLAHRLSFGSSAQFCAFSAGKGAADNNVTLSSA
jgi:hypothetical protein